MGPKITNPRTPCLIGILTLWLGICVTHPGAALRSLRFQHHDSLFLATLQQIYAQNYDSAAILLQNPELEGWASGIYFTTLVDLSRFNDLGDTAALNRARHRLDSLSHILDSKKPPPGTSLDPSDWTAFVGLLHLQASYAKVLAGRNIAAAMEGRKGVSLLEDNQGLLEARAYTLLFEYYKSTALESISWLPFIDRPDGRIKDFLHEQASESRYFAVALTTSLVWLYYDDGQVGEALSLIDAFLANHPRHRVFRQMRADMLFKAGRLKEASNMYRSSLREYDSLALTHPLPHYLPIRKLSAVGNLIRIHHAMGDAEGVETYQRLWKKDASRAHQSWIPQSIRKALDSLPKN